ncbi:hypothetical protein FIV41_23450 [Pseudomonas marginalis]|uniref:Uncharacterized protein n=1 Tax=Pseudomonas marginalis TaxID=298 RepID=A0A9X9BNL4_PSEMA|nr:hypothetical protein PspCFBP13509_30930 [Pseudomonas sp. CFBP13509]TWR54019.1 hypothetical protein FIV41_23450 [Pseudomonas marginalis]
MYWVKNVGGAVRRFDLPPIAVGQYQIHQLTLPHRGQAPSHIWISIQQVDLSLLLLCFCSGF